MRAIVEQADNLSRRESQYLSLAMKIAETSQCRMKHGAVIVKGGRVISVGVNTFRNDPAFVKDYDECSYHAEVNAVVRKYADCFKATIYVARVNNAGEPRLSRPCNECFQVIRESGIKKIIYTS